MQERAAALRAQGRGGDESTRERIVQGGAQAVGKLGVVRCRVQDVLIESGVSRPTFYSHFDSKEALVIELSERHHDVIRERLFGAAASQADPGSQVQAVVESFLRWRAELGPLGRVLDLEARAPGSPLEAHRRRTLRDLVRLGAAGLQEHGRRPVDPVMWYALMAALESIADQLLSSPRPSRAAVERAVALGVRLIGATLAEDDEALPPLPAPPAPGRGGPGGGES